MYLLSGAKSRRTPGPDVETTCPRCQEFGPAESYEVAESLNVFFLPLLTVRNVYLRCQRCGKTVRCSARLADLEHLSPDELHQAVSPSTSSLGRILTLLALVLWIVPGLGLLVGATAWALNGRSRGAWYGMARLATILAGAITAVVALLLIEPFYSR